MEQKSIAKKWPITISICWAIYISALFAFETTCKILKPAFYQFWLSANWPIALYSTLACTVSILAMAAITTLSKRAQVQWLFVTARIILWIYVGYTLLLAIGLVYILATI